jgi:hypothetical protein
MITPYYKDEDIELYCGKAEIILPQLDLRPSLLLSDPPYPNGAGHFVEEIETARILLKQIDCNHKIIFWDEMNEFDAGLPLVAKHIWHRNNTNRPDNYEMIYEYCADGRKRASRVLPYPVIAIGLTGCTEATGHPTQKNKKLIKRLIEMSGERGLILDPYCGSGTTLVAAKLCGMKAIGIEQDEEYCRLAVEKRLNRPMPLFAVSL